MSVLGQACDLEADIKEPDLAELSRVEAERRISILEVQKLDMAEEASLPFLADLSL